MKSHARQVCCVLFALLAISRIAAAVEPVPVKCDGAEEQRFLRLTSDESKRPLSLDTAIVRCSPKGGERGAPTVDLIAAIHIADAKYFRQLNEKFNGYDAVLYELVAPEGSNKPRQGSSPGNHPVSMIQTGMKDLLNLEYQLNGIDYTKENMVHADMSPEQFAESMKERGETVTGMMARMLGYALAKQNSEEGANEAKFFAALFAKNRALELKKALAGQFARGDDATKALEGPAGSTLIAGRNKVALEVLKKELESGKKKIAVFYGAGHMPDLIKRLQEDFGFSPVDTTWLVAWDLNP